MRAVGLIRFFWLIKWNLLFPSASHHLVLFIKLLGFRPRWMWSPVCWVRGCSEPTGNLRECPVEVHPWQAAISLLLWQCWFALQKHFSAFPCLPLRYEESAHPTGNAHSISVLSRQPKAAPLDIHQPSLQFCLQSQTIHQPPQHLWAVLFALDMGEQSRQGFIRALNEAFHPPWQTQGMQTCPMLALQLRHIEAFALPALPPITTGYCRHHHYPARAPLALCAVAVHSFSSAAAFKVTWSEALQKITIWKSYQNSPKFARF